MDPTVEISDDELNKKRTKKKKIPKKKINTTPLLSANDVRSTAKY